MKLDLSNPAHVEALRWACKSRVDGPIAAAEAGPLVHLPYRCGADKYFEDIELMRTALGHIEAPTIAADLIRRLLTRCGVECIVDTADDWITMVGTPRLHFVAVETTIEGDVWRFELSRREAAGRILALLDAPDRDAAMVALKGER